MEEQKELAGMANALNADAVKTANWWNSLWGRDIAARLISPKRGLGVV